MSYPKKQAVWSDMQENLKSSKNIVIYALTKVQLYRHSINDFHPNFLSWPIDGQYVMNNTIGKLFTKASMFFVFFTNFLLTPNMKHINALLKVVCSFIRVKTLKHIRGIKNLGVACSQPKHSWDYSSYAAFCTAQVVN